MNINVDGVPKTKACCCMSNGPRIFNVIVGLLISRKSKLIETHQVTLSACLKKATVKLARK